MRSFVSMKFLRYCLYLSLSGPLFAGPICCGITTDVWDASNGSQVTASSPIHFNSDARNLFGAVLGFVEQGNMVFSDGLAQGFVNWIEWQTPAPHTVLSFYLSAAHDGHGSFGGRDADQRGMSRFQLYGYN